MAQAARVFAHRGQHFVSGPESTKRHRYPRTKSKSIHLISKAIHHGQIRRKSRHYRSPLLYR